jgi:cytochrome c oxidase cbb3-type subunit 3
VGTPSAATVTLPSGAVVTGNLVHLDAFSVSVVDSDGWYHSWPVSKVKLTVKDPLEKHHELIHQYSNVDLHNVFAYLETLK